MIVRETEHEFVMIPQHDHAHLSGMIASHLSIEIMKSEPYYEDFLLAVYQHDRSWIRLDESPIWNDRDSVPFSFTDFPLLPRLILYQYGLNEIETMSKYACLLCSLHYSSFFMSSTLQACIDFKNFEMSHQERIKKELKLLEQDKVSQHFQLLQFCDDLSLYVCLNKPGASKENEHPWYKNGFTKSACLSDNHDVFIANWKNENEISVYPFPFDAEFITTLRQKWVCKEDIFQYGISEAFKLAKYIDQEIKFCK